MPSSSTLTVSRVRAKPASRNMNPACMKNTRKAVISTHMVLIAFTYGGSGTTAGAAAGAAAAAAAAGAAAGEAAGAVAVAGAVWARAFEPELTKNETVRTTRKHAATPSIFPPKIA